MSPDSRRFAAAVLVAALLASPVPVFAGLGDCAQPLTTGAGPAASDCLFILRSAVGSSTCDPQCVCDANAADLITATDALLCLRKAVGQDVALLCDCHACGFFINSTFHYPVSSNIKNGWEFESTSGSGWQGNGGNPGAYFILNESGALNTDPVVRQTVTGLAVGATYEIGGEYRSFAAGFGNPLKPDAFAVTVEPQPSDHDSIVVLALPRPSPVATDWTPFNVVFQASATTATISFVAERDGDDSSFDVDNLCLVPAM